MSDKSVLNIGIVCGEHSGDRLGAGLIRELKKNYEINLYGVGGPKLENLGLKSSFHFSEINIMGLLDPLLKISKLLSLRENLVNLFIKKKIDFFIGIDSPDFNMGIHKALKKSSTNKNLQVVSPSVWGWRQKRIKSIQSYIDLTLCLFKFEHDFYKKVGHNSFHLGHPFYKLIKENKEEIIQKYSLNDSKKYLCILPVSRKSEVRYMMQIYLEFVKKHYKNHKDYFYLISSADKKLTPEIEKYFDLTSKDLPIMIAEESTRDFLSLSSLSIVTSGTATLEASILECPPVICYKTNFLNYSIISRMLKIDDVGLPNLLLGKRYYLELIQKECNAKNILDAVTETEDKIQFSSEQARLIRLMIKGRGYSEAVRAITAI